MTRKRTDVSNGTRFELDKSLFAALARRLLFGRSILFVQHFHMQSTCVQCLLRNVLRRVKLELRFLNKFRVWMAGWAPDLFFASRFTYPRTLIYHRCLKYQTFH